MNTMTNETTLIEPAYFLIFQGQNILLFQNENTYRLPTLLEISSIKPYWAHFQSLGFYHEQNCYGARLLTDLTPPEHTSFIPLRQAFNLLPDHWFPVIARSIEILNWDQNHQFCGHCGTKTAHIANTFERHCLSCGLIAHPRISPSVIVMIQKENDILLARNANFTSGMFGLIAGYVEPGESAEEAVKREVREEVAIEITNIRYFGSQTWPFPDALMLAFTADYASGEIQVDNHEIVEAGWYNKTNFPQWPAHSKSIARKMIEGYLIKK